MNRLLFPLALALASLLAACGAEKSHPPTSFSGPVGIAMKLRSSDVDGTAPYAVNPPLTKSINTESGNPYGAFVNDATTAIGQPPSRIAVAAATLELLPGSSGVTNLNQVFTGTVLVGFELAGVVRTVGTVTNPTGTSVVMTTAFDSSSLDPAAYSDLLAGGFPVVLDGYGTAAFAAGSSTAELKATIGLLAFR